MIKYYFVLIYVFVFFHCSAQKVLSIAGEDGKLPASPEMIAEVKQFNQFVERFNYEKTFRNETMNEEFRNQMSRKDYILYLFDFEDSRIDKSKDAFNPEYIQQKEAFVSQVVNDSVYLDYLLSGIFVEATCQATFNNKPIKTVVIFKKVVNQDKSSRWDIATVVLGKNIYHKKAPVESTALPPNANETGFLRIQSLFEDEARLSALIAGNSKENSLSRFYEYILKGEFDFEHVFDMTYHITSVPGWIVRVKNFNRNTLNSGWLVADLKKIDKKDGYKKYLHQTLHTNP